MNRPHAHVIIVLLLYIAGCVSNNEISGVMMHLMSIVWAIAAANEIAGLWRKK